MAHLPKRIFLLAQMEGLLSSAILFTGLLIVLGFTAKIFAVGRFDVWTTAVILTACGAVSSSLTLHYYARSSTEAAKKLHILEYLVSLHVFVPILTLAFLYSFFHIDQVDGARHSGWVWLGIHHAVGFGLALILFYLLKVRLTESERELLILGGITLSAGVAAYLHLSPVVICFIAGIIFANLPGFNNLLMENVLRHAERPVYFIMLILAGSLWNFKSLFAWGFLVIYILIRLLAKGFALWAVSRAEPRLRLRFPTLGGIIAQGPLAIAMVVGYKQLYAGPLLDTVVTAILAGGFINELLAGRLLQGVLPPPEPQKS